MGVSKKVQMEQQAALEEYFKKRHLNLDVFKQLKKLGLLSLVQRHNRPALKVTLTTITGDTVKEYRRFLDENGRKSDLKNLPDGQGLHGFLFHEINPRMPLIIVEGMFDFIAIWPYYQNVVCIASANGLCPCIDQILQKYPTAQIYVAGDLGAATDTEISKLFNLDQKYRTQIFDARSYLKRTSASDINDYIIAGHKVDSNTIIAEAVCIEDFLCSDVYDQIKQDFTSKLFEYIDTKELSFNVWKELQEYFQEQMKYTNDFFIIPKNKKVFYDETGEVELETHWHVVCINQYRIQRMNLSNTILASRNKFDEILLTKNGLCYTANSKYKKEYLGTIKATLDYFENNNLVSVEEIVQSIGFQGEDAQTFRACNGDYDFMSKVFTPRIYHSPQITQTINFYPQDDPDIKAGLKSITACFGKIFKEQFHINIFSAFLFASIFKPEIKNLAGGFPLFYYGGRRGLGKSFVNSILLFGCGYDGAIDPRVALSNVTEPSLRTTLATINYIVILDEYKYPKIKPEVANSVDSLLLGNYDGLVSTRGNRPGGNLGTTVVAYSNEAVIIFSGMGVPSAEEIATRSIILKLKKSQIYYLDERLDELKEEMREGFFNIFMLKSDIDIKKLFAAAVKWVNSIVPQSLDKRLKNNLASLAVLHMYDQTLLPDFEQNIRDYSNAYDDIIVSYSTANNIVTDIINNPSRYIDLKTMVMERKKQALFINKKTLFINIPQLLRQFKRYNQEPFDNSIVSEEFQGMLDLSGYGSNGKMINYDLLKYKNEPKNNRRSKNYGVSIAQVKNNKYLVQIYNAVLEKIKSDIDLLEKDRYFTGDVQAIYDALDPNIDTLSVLDEE